jgi:hypothetical protein
MKKCVFFILVFGILCGLNLIYADQTDKKDSDVILYSGFEDGKTGDWKGRGTAVLNVTDTQAFKGKYSLLVTKRTDGWNGAEVSLTDKLFKDGVYKISAWVRIKDGQPDSKMSLTAQREKGGKQDWDTISAASVKQGKWENLTGEYSPKNDFDRISVYVEAADKTLDYYLDEASITVVKLPPVGKIETKPKEVKTVTAKMGTPVIDGIEDEVWNTTQEIKIDVFAEGENGSTGTAKVLWDETHLYVFVKVIDNNLQMASGNAWEQDSVEIFVDEKNNKSADYAKDDAQYRINFKNDKSFGGTPSKINSTVVVTKDGYNVEAAILLKVKKGAVGDKIGFDLQINNDAGSGKRDSISKWSDPTNDSYKDTSRFGVLELVK